MEIATESPKTIRDREKLEEQLKKEKEYFTDSAKHEAIEKINRAIASHASERVCLTEKEIRLFDGNQNPAEPSSRIHEIAKSLGIE